MRTEFVQAAVAIVAIMNPIGTAPIFQNMVSPLPRPRQRIAALHACLFIAVILIATAFAGRVILDLFGISIDAFRAAGGVVIGIMGYQMLRGAKSAEHEALADEKAIRENLLVPFAMPLVAGPGTITTVITLALSHTSYGIPWTALVAIGVGVLVTGACLFTILAVGRYFSVDAQRIFTRFMGLVLMAMGMEFLLKGTSAFIAHQTVGAMAQ
ncbi:MAG: NAAT family transporter [Salinibacterium sp.]|nr:NAAT family transporter [Salinibacterium sp.]